MPSVDCDLSFNKSCLEVLPDEILLQVCRYLSTVHILDALLNLNTRLNKTITSYRETISLSHLSYKDFHRLIVDYLPSLAPNVDCLFINSSSTLKIGQLFEKRFPRIDQQFPVLRQLVFHQIDLETLENISWRFNSMKYLHELDIDISEQRLSSMPTQFDQFLCGKLFASSNSLRTLKLNLTNYRFSLDSIKTQCVNIRQLTISVKRLHDLLTIFDFFPNIERLNISIGCRFPFDTENDKYSYDQLWWKTPYLTALNLTIEGTDLMVHELVIPCDVIMSIVQNLHALTSLKFTLNVAFHYTLLLATTKELYISKYFPYANGLLWQRALERNEKRTIHFELYLELDIIESKLLNKKSTTNYSIFSTNNDIDFHRLLKTTFCNAYWLQRNIQLQCLPITSRRMAIFTVPLTQNHLSISTNVVNEEFLIKSYTNVQSLTLRNDTDHYCAKLSVLDLLTKFPALSTLQIDGATLLSPTISICFNRLRFLSLQSYSLRSCCELLTYLPRVTSLSVTNFRSHLLDIDSCSTPMSSISRLKLFITSMDTNNVSDITRIFPKLRELSLTIKSITQRPTEEMCPLMKFASFTQELTDLRYIEVVVPISKGSSSTFWHSDDLLQLNHGISCQTVDGSLITTVAWL